MDKTEKKKPLTFEEFAALRPGEQRKAIAEDILRALLLPADKKTLDARRGDYLMLSQFLEALDPEMQLCEFLSKQRCAVCGIGAVFVTAVKLANNIKICDVRQIARGKTFINYEDLLPFASQFVPPEQLALIEVVFEGRATGFSLDALGDEIISRNDVARAVQMHEGVVHAADPTADLPISAWTKRDFAEDLLRAIMQNVVDNNGEFVVPDNGVEPTTEEYEAAEPG